MKGVVLRLAEPGDAGRLNQALARLSEDLGDAHHATTEQLATSGWGRHPVFRAILAENGDGIIAAALYSATFSTARGGVMAYVSDLWVAEAARGSGLGRRLLAAVARDAAETWGAKMMKLNVYHTTPRARSFYDRLGFAPATQHTELHLDAPGCAALRGPT